MKRERSDDSTVEDAAITWLAERDDGFTPARAREFADWLRADRRHAAAVARLEQTLARLEEAPAFRAGLEAEFGRPGGAVPFPAPRRRVFWLGAAAAGFALVLGAAALLRPAARDSRHVTVAGGYERSRLADGTLLELNGGSAARVRYTAGERRVEFERGEAHFDVTPDPQRPFVVVVGGVAVRAVGTAFNVRYHGTAVEVTVTEGKVRVARGDAAATLVADASLVTAGERARVEPAEPAPVVERVAPEALRAALAWQGRLVELADAPLAEVVARFNARNVVQLVLADPALGGRRIGGTFALDEVEAFVRLLARDGEIVAERRGAHEILLRPAR